MRALSAAFALVLLGGCSCGDDCVGIRCEACPPAIQIDVRAPGTTTPPTVDGTIPLECHARPGGWVCVAASAPVGAYAFDVALGDERATVTLELVEGGDACCSCPTRGGLAQVDFGGAAVDGGDADAGGGDAGGGDAGAGGDAGRVDGATDDGGAAACDPSLVEFPMGGALEPGTLCDDVFACVPASAVASVQASTVFDCTAGSDGLACASGEVSCRYADPGGPSTLDEAEIANVCALTVHAPPPSRVVCRVYL